LVRRDTTYSSTTSNSSRRCREGQARAQRSCPTGRRRGRAAGRRRRPRGRARRSSRFQNHLLRQNDRLVFWRPLVLTCRLPPSTVHPSPTCKKLARLEQRLQARTMLKRVWSTSPPPPPATRRVLLDLLLPLEPPRLSRGSGERRARQRGASQTTLVRLLQRLQPPTSNSRLT